MYYCAEAASDERGALAYGEVGDQKQMRGDPQDKEEVRIRALGSGDFTLILRYPDAEKRKAFAKDAREIALNPNIGYAQYGDDKNNYAGRYGLWYAMHGVDNFRDIDVPCNCDCSALVADVLIHNGLNCSRYMRTAIEVNELEKLGFKQVPYALQSLTVGDVLWRQGHTAICIGENEEEEGKVYSRTITSSTITKKWSTGAGVLTRSCPYIAVKKAELDFKPQVIVCQQVGEILANTQWIRGQAHAYCANYENDATAGIAVGTAAGYFNPDAAVIYIPVRFPNKDYEVKIYG